jgi:hypothetical protein
LFSNEKWYYSRGIQFLQIRHISDFRENTKQILEANKCYDELIKHFESNELKAIKYSSKDHFLQVIIVIFLIWGRSLLEFEDEQARPFFQALVGLADENFA